MLVPGQRRFPQAYIMLALSDPYHSAQQWHKSTESSSLAHMSGCIRQGKEREDPRVSVSSRTYRTLFRRGFLQCFGRSCEDAQCLVLVFAGKIVFQSAGVEKYILSESFEEVSFVGSCKDDSVFAHLRYPFHRVASAEGYAVGCF